MVDDIAATLDRALLLETKAPDLSLILIKRPYLPSLALGGNSTLEKHI